MYSKIIVFTSLFLFLCVAPLSSQMERELTLPLSNAGKRGTLEIDIKKGAISVKGTNRSDIKIHFKAVEQDNEDHDHDDHKESKTPSKDLKGLKKIAGSTIPDMEISEQDNKVLIHAENWMKGMNVEVEIPYDFDISLHSYHNGNISVDNIKGVVELETYHGPITAKNISGSLVATTFHGEILVDFKKVTANTPLAFTTYHGDVDISFPSDYKGSVKAKTENGDVYSGFDINFKTGDNQLQTEKTSKGTKTYLESWIKGDINGGGPEVLMKNYFGDIFIRKK